ncbi:hypothetical protein MMC19_002638 [Ptychographa xylographoides]|nr:hypothetical protein [Ptychographa xylographoides]
MPALLSIALTPLILFVSIPVFLFAVFTSTITFWTLLIRVLIVYFELGVVVIHKHLSSPSIPKDEPPLSRKKSNRSFVSRSSSGSITPRLPAPGTSIYPTTPLARDFEGVGGWRFPEPEEDDSDSLWTTMNSRLELPALSTSGGERKLKHQHSLTTLATIVDRPFLRRTSSQRPRPISALVSGTTSPEEIFAETNASRSVGDMGETALGMNMGRVRIKHRKSSSSSTGSSGKISQVPAR